jgi:hypothetical protein
VTNSQRNCLAPLAALSPNLGGDSDAERKAALLRMLRKAARSAQNGQAQPFYSIRTVASQFCVPRSSVSRIFNELKSEGLLTSAWGSRTVLQPKILDRHVQFRGVLAMLTPTESFAGDLIARRSFRALWTKLWSLGFATRVWLYDPAEADRPLFIDGIFSEKPDGIVWLMPHRRVTLLSHRLLDCGIRVIQLAAAMSYVEMLQQVSDAIG